MVDLRISVYKSLPSLLLLACCSFLSLVLVLGRHFLVRYWSGMEWAAMDGNTLRWCGMERDGAALTGMD